MTESVFQDVHPSLLKRKIIHVDMDAYYAAVEIRENPALKGKPVIVGGNPKGRGVVTTCSYEARKFGIHSAMPAAVAIRRCPQAVFVRPNFELYVTVSRQIKEIFRRYTPHVQPLSLDEAFLDVTNNQKGLFATEIAKLVRADIASELQLTASAGVAPNKMLAKIASDYRKPDGLTVVRPDQAAAFMWDLPVNKIPGIGPKTFERLNRKGIKYCRDVLQMDRNVLIDRLGETGLWLVKRSKGLDPRPVTTGRGRKSLGKERTFSRDLDSQSQVDTKLREIAQSVGETMREKKIRGKTVSIKVRYRGFETVTRAKTSKTFLQEPGEIYQIARLLVARTDAYERPVRLLGVSISNMDQAASSRQLTLFGD